MRRVLKSLICVAMGAMAAGQALGFSTWGPLEPWQTQDMDYGIRYLPCTPAPDLVLEEVQGPGIISINTELGGTKNFDEGSRLNVPIITYAYDYTFLSYFGAQGVAAVDSAFAVLNGLPAASNARLTQFVTEGNQQINYTAQALRMLDLKSIVMWLMLEHMGLIGETHTYDLRERVAIPGASDPCTVYCVVLTRNFDPITYNASEYVNGNLLTYQIGCLAPAVDVGDAMEASAQVGRPPLSAVATREALQVGGYYVRITRDDMGGLRYLYRQNRYVNEGFDPETRFTSAQSSWNPVSFNVTNVPLAGGTFAALVGGVEKIQFVKTAYDSLLGIPFRPITNHYTIPQITNGTLVTLNVARTVTAPDIIFTAGDLTFPGPDPYQETLERSSPTANFITYGSPYATGQVQVNGAYVVTPAVITPQLTVTLNNSGQVYYNIAAAFGDQATAVDLGYIWGSFNGSTNAPIPFPTGTSLNEIEAEVLSAGPETEIGIYNPVLTSSTSTTTGTGGGATGAGAGGNP